MQKFQIRDYKKKNQKSAPRMFDLIINEEGIPFIETKNEKVSHKISLTEAFKQAGKKIEYTIEGQQSTERPDPYYIEVPTAGVVIQH